MTDTITPAAKQPLITTASILAVGSLVIFGYAMVYLLNWPIPAINEKLLFTALGFLCGSMVGVAFGAYFGTNKSGEARELLKSQAIADQASTAKVLAESTTTTAPVTDPGVIEGAVTIDGGAA